jgi:hypothetical protein
MTRRPIRVRWLIGSATGVVATALYWAIRGTPSAEAVLASWTPEEPRMDAPCQHPARKAHGRHETYLTPDGSYCRACGARERGGPHIPAPSDPLR